MGMVEDVRQVLQDFVAPELRALAERMTALEKQMDERFAHAERRTDERFVHLEQRMDERSVHLEQRLTSLETQMASQFNILIGAIREGRDYNALMERMSRLEEMQREKQQTPPLLPPGGPSRSMRGR
jgi:uncharacterized coiled-coil protein SlyX